ncbi:hypothetical protein [Sulfitobacter sabulilitoris]|nr:hypothetical protein [Sulfitobacter sabulilitoris]
MPAPKLTKASVGNLIQAIRAAGLTPAAIHVEPNGGIRVDIAFAPEGKDPTVGLSAANNDALCWEEVA